MKKILMVSAMISFTATSIFFAVSVWYKWKEKKVETQKAMNLPGFHFKNLAGNIVSGCQNTGASKRLIVNYFDPGCEHCQYMAKEYVKNSDKLGEVNILMITVADSSSIVQFKKECGIDEMLNITILRDYKFQFKKLFGTSVVPSFFVYHNGRLVKRIIGETKIENLID